MYFICDYCGKEFWLNDECEACKKMAKRKLKFCDDYYGHLQRSKCRDAYYHHIYLLKCDRYTCYFCGRIFFRPKYYGVDKEKPACSGSCSRRRGGKRKTVYATDEQMQAAHALGINEKVLKELGQHLWPIIELKVLHLKLKKEIRNDRI